MTKQVREDDDGVLAAEYVLGVLTQAERNAFAPRLPKDAALRVQVGYWEQHFSAFNEEYASANPPPALRSAIQKRLFGAEVKLPIWQSLGFWRSMSFASLAALALVIAVPYALKPNSVTTPHGTSIAELSGEAKAVKMDVSYDSASSTLRYAVVNGKAADGRDFELWAIVGKNAPVSLGVIAANAPGSINVPAQVAAQIADAVLAISDEPKGGSPTGQPTGAVLSTGKLTRI